MDSGRRRVAWTVGAQNDLDAAVAYVAEDSISSALQVLDRILAAAASLDSFAERGRAVPEWGSSSVRELLVDPLRVLYLVEEQRVVVLGILHQRRDFDRWIGDVQRRGDPR